MQVEAIYKQGAIQLVHPLRFKRDNVKLLVTVQDEDLLTAPTTMQAPQQPQQAASSYAARLDRILAPYQHLLQSRTGQASMNYQAIWEDHLSDRYLGGHEKSDI
jgi:hypothetical protein